MMIISETGDGGDCGDCGVAMFEMLKVCCLGGRVLVVSGVVTSSLPARTSKSSAAYSDPSHW